MALTAMSAEARRRTHGPRREVRAPREHSDSRDGKMMSRVISF